MISNTDSDVWIKTLTLNNFRMYKHLEVSFEKDYTVLIGLNGAGKSTILDALCPWNVYRCIY
jgi:DNA repair exonuclease SbcCD ATPase subunit